MSNVLDPLLLLALPDTTHRPIRWQFRCISGAERPEVYEQVEEDTVEMDAASFAGESIRI